MAAFDGVASFQDGDGEAADLLEEGDAVGRGLAAGHLGMEHYLAVPVALLKLPAGLHLGQGQGLVVVVLYDFHLLLPLLRFGVADRAGATDMKTGRPGMSPKPARVSGTRGRGGWFQGRGGS